MCGIVPAVKGASPFVFCFFLLPRGTAPLDSTFNTTPLLPAASHCISPRYSGLGIVQYLHEIGPCFSLAQSASGELQFTSKPPHVLPPLSFCLYPVAHPSPCPALAPSTRLHLSRQSAHAFIAFSSMIDCISVISSDHVSYQRRHLAQETLYSIQDTRPLNIANLSLLRQEYSTV